MTFIRGLPDEAESRRRGGDEDVETQRAGHRQDSHCDVPAPDDAPHDYLPRTIYMPAYSA